MVGKCAQAFRSTQHEISIWLKRVMERGNHPLLQGRAEINQKVPATHQVQVGKGRILGDVLVSKNAHFADGLVDLISAVELHKEPLQALGRDFRRRRLGVKATARAIESAVTYISSKNLDRFGSHRGKGNISDFLPHIFKENNGDRVDFFAGRASRHPDAYRRLIELAVAK